MNRFKFPAIVFLILGAFTFAHAGVKVSGSQKIGIFPFETCNCSTDEVVQVMRELSLLLKKHGVGLIGDYEIRQAARKNGSLFSEISSSDNFVILASQIHATRLIKGTVNLINDSNTYLLSISIYDSQGMLLKNFVLNSTGKSFNDFLNTTVKQMSQKILANLSL
jgi:hypothetical protein